VRSARCSVWRVVLPVVSFRSLLLCFVCRHPGFSLRECPLRFPLACQVLGFGFTTAECSWFCSWTRGFGRQESPLDFLFSRVEFSELSLSTAGYSGPVWSLYFLARDFCSQCEQPHTVFCSDGSFPCAWLPRRFFLVSVHAQECAKGFLSRPSSQIPVPDFTMPPSNRGSHLRILILSSYARSRLVTLFPAWSDSLCQWLVVIFLIYRWFLWVETGLVFKLLDLRLEFS
jgi:hypothetical protein